MQLAQVKLIKIVNRTVTTYEQTTKFISHINQSIAQSNKIMGCTKSKSNSLFQIESGKIVKITANLPKSFEISQMLASQPIFTSWDEIDDEDNDQCQGSNPRKICLNSDYQPFSAIGVVFVEFTSKYRGYGTAFLIADYVALTAAHNIYSREGQCFAKQVNLIMKVHQKRRKTFRVVCAYVPKEYKQGAIQNKIKNNDFAILILGVFEELTNSKYGKIELSSDVEVKDQVQVYGYPDKFSKEQNQQITNFQGKSLQEKQNENKGKIQKKKYLFSSKDEIVKLEIERMFYKANTSKGVSGSPILRINGSSLKYEAVGIHTTGHKIQNSGVRITSKLLIRINQWIKTFWEGRENDERIMLIHKSCYQIATHKRINPDTTTYAWKQNKKYYRQDNANKNVCISNGGDLQWLCSVQDLCDGECVLITIKVHKVQTYYDDQQQRYYSYIWIGLMDSNYKGKQRSDTFNHCVYLYIGGQKIHRPNQEQTKQELIGCSCQSSLSSVPCLIECYVDIVNQSTVHILLVKAVLQIFNKQYEQFNKQYENLNNLQILLYAQIKQNLSERVEGKNEDLIFIFLLFSLFIYLSQAYPLIFKSLLGSTGSDLSKVTCQRNF